MKFHLKPEAGTDVVFDGEKVAESDPPKTDLDRWKKLVVFKTTKGRFVLAIYGVSQIPGEVERLFEAIIHETPTSLAWNLWREREDGTFYLSSPSKSVMSQLMRRFPECPEFNVVQEA